MLNFEKVSFGYAESPLLQDFSFSAKEGEATAILGPSGFGKTTLMGLACDFLKPQKGVITPFESAKASFVFQENRLLPHLTALENLKAVNIDEETAKEYLEKVGLGESENKLPGELSGGMCRRLALARSLAFGGDCFYFDEPLQGLDIKTSGEILSLIKNEIAGKTALIITHSPAEAFALCDRIVLVGKSPLQILAEAKKSDFSDEKALEDFIKISI